MSTCGHRHSYQGEIYRCTLPRGHTSWHADGMRCTWMIRSTDVIPPQALVARAWDAITGFWRRPA